MKASKIKIERGQIVALYNAQHHLASNPDKRWLEMSKNLQALKEASQKTNDLFQGIKQGEGYDQKVDELFRDTVEIDLYTFSIDEFKDKPLAASSLTPAIGVILK